MNGESFAAVNDWVHVYRLNVSDTTKKIVDEACFEKAVWGSLDNLLHQLGVLLTSFPTLESGVGRFFRFVRNTRSPVSFLAFLERDTDALPVLLRILSLESPSAEWLVKDPDSFDWLRLTAGQSVSIEHLSDVILAEISSLDDEVHLLSAMQMFRRRETLRVMCAFCLHGMPWHEVSQQLTFIAESALAATVHVASRSAGSKKVSNQELSKRMTIVGLGAFGGSELDFRQPIEILFLRESEPTSVPGELVRWQEEFDRFSERVVSWLSHKDGFAYEVKQPFFSEKGVRQDSSAVVEGRRWLQQVDNSGRTKHKFALLKARHVFGDPMLSQPVLEEVPALLFQRFLSGTDVASLGAAYRRIHRRDDAGATDSETVDTVNESLITRWRTELEFFVGYLQLLHGGEYSSVREPNTLRAIEALAKAKCVTESERGILVSTLGKLQSAVFQEQQSDDRIDKFFWNQEVPAQRCEIDSQPLLEAIGRVRQIQQHLQGEVFSGAVHVAIESDLILDPNPSPNWVEDLLAKYRFQRSHAAYQHLMELAREEIRMLSTRRCRHFLAAIAPTLLSKIGQTPDPDLALENLAKTTRSLGGKGVLWELFSRHEPSMDLYVRLCGASPYLVSLLVNNPGMIDELMDSLMLNRLPDEHQLETTLYELCRGAEDIAPILGSFKSAMHLNVGVREVLGKESIVDTHRALSDIADVSINQVIENEYHSLTKKLGVPQKTNSGLCRFAFAAVGKYGSREPNYHSDLALLCLYESEGETAPVGISRRHTPFSNSDFFHQLTQRVSQSLNRAGRFGRLYETKIWNLSHERSSTLSWSSKTFSEAIAINSPSALKRVELADFRVVCGDREYAEELEKQVYLRLGKLPWSSEDTKEIRQERQLLESTAHQRNLKRGYGGTIDLEWLCRILAFRSGKVKALTHVSGTTHIASMLAQEGVLSKPEAETIVDSYRYLRGIESGLRLMNTAARHDLPKESLEMERLAYVLHLSSGGQLESECDRFRSLNRELFDKYVS